MDQFIGRIGLKVQAVDEIGRWESARIIHSDPSQVKVTFIGWSSEFDIWISEPTNIRAPVCLSTPEEPGEL